MIASSGSGPGSYLVLVVLVVIAVMTSRARRRQRREPLPEGTPALATGAMRRERIRPIMITMIDPVYSVIIIGPAWLRWVGVDTAHIVAAVVGGLVGAGVGIARARAMYVRRIPGTTNIVLRRSPLEYGLLVFILVARLSETKVEQSGSPTATVIFTGLISFALVETIVRAGAIVLRFQRDVSPQPVNDGPDVR